VRDKIEEIRALERVATSQNEMRPWLAEGCEAIEQRAPLFRCELARIGARRCLGAAMPTGKTARACDLPVDAPGGAIESQRA
jgi:hypothetical protein